MSWGSTQVGSSPRSTQRRRRRRRRRNQKRPESRSGDPRRRFLRAADRQGRGRQRDGDALKNAFPRTETADRQNEKTPRQRTPTKERCRSSQASRTAHTQKRRQRGSGIENRENRMHEGAFVRQPHQQRTLEDRPFPGHHGVPRRERKGRQGRTSVQQHPATWTGPDLHQRTAIHWGNGRDKARAASKAIPAWSCR